MQTPSNGFAVSMGRILSQMYFPGGAFDTKRTECHTEARTESHKTSAGCPDVTFRVVREGR